MNERIEAVQRMQDYIAAHLDEEITLAALAGASLYSPWYSYRLFVGTVGLSPAEYIRRLRLSKSALRLRDTACRITDVALEAGFGSVDGFGGRSVGNSGAIRATTQRTQNRFRCLSPTASNTELSKGERPWKASKPFSFRLSKSPRER